MIITIIIVAAAKLCEKLLRLLGRGATTFPGKLALFLKKDILSFLSRGVKVIAVTGTNGKTTTARIIETGLKKAGKSCFLNRSGANLTQSTCMETAIRAALSTDNTKTAKPE